MAPSRCPTWTIPGDVTLLTELDEVIATVQRPRIEVEEVPEVEEEEGAEGAEAAEGEGGPAAEGGEASSGDGAGGDS